MKFLYNPPKIIRRIFSNFIWETSNNKILLTFDDGPNPGVTENILKILNKENVKALFFCVGQNVNSYKNLAKEILNEGHMVGNHTFNHKRLTKLSYKDSLTEINTFSELVENNYNLRVKYFRPPYGRINFRTENVMDKLDLQCVMWNLLTFDYKNDFKKVKFSVDNFLQSNSLIVLHDSVKTKDIIVESIEYIVERAAQKGFEFGEPEECLN